MTEASYRNLSGFEVSGLTLDLDNKALATYTRQAEPEHNSTASWLIGCEAALNGIDELTLLKRLGYQQLRIHLSADYHYDRASKLMQLSMQQSADDLFELELGAVMDLGINDLNRHNLALANPSVGDLSFNYRDRSLKRYLNFCAKGSQETPEQFVARHIGLMQQLLQPLGVVVEENVIDAYRRFLLGGGHLQVSLLSGKQLRPQSLMQYAPEQWVEVLEPELRVDGQKVEPLAIRWQVPETEEEEIMQAQVLSKVEEITSLLQAPFVEPEPEPEPVDAVDPELLQSPSQFSGRSGYREVSLEGLRPHVGSNIRIRTRNGYMQEGRLLSIEHKELRIYRDYREVGLGDAILPIAYKHIDKVLVYRQAGADPVSGANKN